MAERSIVLDTETTGMPVSDGHRVIEIGGVELIGRRPTGRTFHVYLNPERDIDEGAIAVHGIRNEDLLDKPFFRDVADDFFDFIQGAELIIHNAAFDVGFICNEFKLVGSRPERAELNDYCSVLDSLQMARERHPGQRNSLDALCRRYGIDNSNRDLHGALLDARLLAEVYLAMTGGQTHLILAGQGSDEGDGEGWADVTRIRRVSTERTGKVIPASEDDLQAHLARLAAIEKAAGGPALWTRLDG